ncbi:hypothetical protein HPG69_006486 [Diceros bicornis minor]|uniref:Disintegrin and metalloproteinase domain-containing protein 15 n=1 Tax=Diceros bicornis minor TaxID=77932 RepID=A0A7J7EWR1_DICBM|nr:hypothetical protein HPG69_006486 [Diceros bicornis minor]
MRLALLWALGLLGAGSPLPSRPLPDIADLSTRCQGAKWAWLHSLGVSGDPAGGTEEEQGRPERKILEPQILQDNLTLSLAEVLQTSLPEALRITLELDGESHILELLQNRELVPGRPTLVWYQPDGTRVVSEGHTLEHCCYEGGVQGRADSWVSVCTCSGLRGLVILSPERSYTLELGPGDLQGPPIISRIQDLLLPGHTCALSGRASVSIQAPPERPLGWNHSRRQRRDVVTETKIVELVIVADHSEVQKYQDFQRLLNRTLEVALLLDTFFRPLNVRVVLVGLEAWTQRDLVEISQDPGLTLDNFLRWRRVDLLRRLPHDSAQLVTATSFSGPVVGMAIQNSICSPDFSGGVNMDHSTSILGVASSIAHELGHSLGLDHDSPGNSCPCPGPAPAKSCIMEASTDFLPGLNFSNCSRWALEKALLNGMGSCLFERLPGLPSMAKVCGNMFVDPGEQCDCGFADDCTDPCCDYVTCQLRPGAQCASNGPCCQNCQLRPAGWQCRPPRGDCDLPEFCPGNSSQCPPDVSLGDGEPCAGGQAVCMEGRCASYTQQCQALWGPGAQPATPLCLLTANTRGDAFGSCGRSPRGSYVSCASRDAICGQLQCQGGLAQPLLGSARDLHWETLEVNGTQLNCSWVHLDLGNDVAQPLLTLPGTACGPGLVSGLGGQDQVGRDIWTMASSAQPSLSTKSEARPSPSLPFSMLRAAQSGPPERPGPPQRALLVSGAKAELADRPNPPTRPLPVDPVVRRSKSQGPVKPPPPRKPLPADPQGQRPLGDLPGPGAGIPPLVLPSRPAPPPPAVSSLYL